MTLWDIANNGQYTAADPNAQANQALQGFAAAYPRLVQQTNAQMTPIAQSQLGAARAVTPGYNDLAQGELARLAPQIAQTQGALDAGQARADISNLNTYGQQAGQALRATDASANPEFYQNLGIAGGKFSDALNALSPTLSAGQRAEMERSNARMNPNAADNSAVNTAAKAMNFGSAAQGQATNFANTINSLSSGLGSLRSGLSPVSTALGRDSRTAPTLGAVTPMTKTDASAQQLGGGVWNGMLNTANEKAKIDAGKYKSMGDALLQDSEGFKNVAGSIGGFTGKKG